MRRPMLLAMSGAVLFSMAITLIAASFFLQTTPLSSALGSSADGAHVVRQFYAAVNTAIATGDTSAVRRVVSPQFVEHDLGPGMRPGRDGLEDALAAFHTVSPEMRLVAETAVAADGRIMARVTVQGAGKVMPTGGGIIGPTNPWDSLDIFTVESGRIVERWRDTDTAVIVRPLANVSIELPLDSPRVITLERLRIAPGERWTALAVGPKSLFIEAGALQVSVASLPLSVPVGEARGPMAVPETPTASPAGLLSLGQSLVVPAGAQAETMNVGADVVQVLFVSFDLPRFSAVAPFGMESRPPGVVRQILAGGLATDAPIGSATLVLEQMTLAPNAWVSLRGAKGPALLAIESGHLSVESWGRVSTGRGSGWTRTDKDEVRLGVGDGLQLHPDSLALLHNPASDPAVALVLTLRPERAPAPTVPVP